MAYQINFGSGTLDMLTVANTLGVNSDLRTMCAAMGYEAPDLFPNDFWGRTIFGFFDASFSKSSGNQIFTVSFISPESWTMSDNRDWISITGTSGGPTGYAGGGSQITLTENYFSARTGTLTLSCASYTCTVNITQAAGINLSSYPFRLSTSSASLACAAPGTNVRYFSGAFETTTKLYTDYTGSTYAENGWYSNGVKARYWNKGSASFTSTSNC